VHGGEYCEDIHRNFSIYHNKTKTNKNNENILNLKKNYFSSRNSCKQNRIYTLLVILFIKNSFTEYLYTLWNKTLWLSSCLAKPQLRLVQNRDVQIRSETNSNPIGFRDSFGFRSHNIHFGSEKYFRSRIGLRLPGLLWKLKAYGASI
jgi:hypothetical protein